MSLEDQDIVAWHKVGGRQQLNDTDYKFIVHVLQNKEGVHREAIKVDPEFRDELLDDEILVDAILESPLPLPISVDLYFYVLVRRALLESNITSRPIADYTVLLLKKGLHVKEAFNNDINEGKTFFYVSDCLQKIQEASPEKQFFLRVQFGNQALLETSIFEDHLRFRTERYGAPNLNFIEAVGGAQYQAAMDHRLAEEFKLRKVLELLGGSFPKVRKALGSFSDRFISFGDPFLPGNDLLGDQD